MPIDQYIFVYMVNNLFFEKNLCALYPLISSWISKPTVPFRFFLFFNFQKRAERKIILQLFLKKSGTHFSITLIHANETTLIHFLIKGNLLYSAGEKYMNTRLNAPSRLKEKLKTWDWEKIKGCLFIVLFIVYWLQKDFLV